MSKKRPPGIMFPREVLLVEIERHCADMNCNARTRIGLTKAEARLYDGFECERCELWQADGLSERDIPDWWEELTITGLAALRPDKSAADASETNGAGEGGGVVARLSEAWQQRRKARGAGRSLPDGVPESAPDDMGDEPV
jgi:hypothetical protein